jgi:hypothetical protein
MKPATPKIRRKSAARPPKRQRSVWTGVKRKGLVSPLQLHLPGLGGVIL